MVKIERIALSRKPAQRFQVFEVSEGSMLDDTQWGLDSRQVKTDVRCDTVTEIRISQGRLYFCLAKGDERTDTHEVILEARGVSWEVAGNELGAGYVTWGVIDGNLDRTLLDFSNLRKTDSKL